jgi:hypothetical protein
VDAVYLICLEISEHILQKARRLSYRFERVKIITSLEYIDIHTGNYNIETLEVSQEFCSKFQSLECTKISREFDYVGRGDLAEKRTFAIQNALDNQFKKILIIDDDIWPIPEIHRRIFLNSKYDIGGQPPLEQPDLSAIERIDRSARTFHNGINGNYLYLRLNKSFPFFPRIYNEDWIFLTFINDITSPVVFDGGHRIFQSRRQIINSDRAYFEEFGELVIDILLTAKQRSLSILRELANQIYFNRRSYLIELGETAVGEESTHSVEAALRALDAFDPSFALDYIKVVRAEMGRWRYA